MTGGCLALLCLCRPGSSSFSFPLLLLLFFPSFCTGISGDLPLSPTCPTAPDYPTDKQTLLLETTVAVEAVASPATCQKGVRDDALRTQV